MEAMGFISGWIPLKEKAEGLSITQSSIFKRDHCVALPVIGPTIGALDQCTQVIDFAGMIEIMTDHNADDIAGRQSFSPIGEAVALQLGVVRKGTDGIKPTAMTLYQPVEKLIVWT